MKKFALNTIFRFNDDVMKECNIPKIELIDGREEIWTYCKFDNKRDIKFIKCRRYLVSNYGRVYDCKMNSLLKPLSAGVKSSNGYYYQYIALKIGDEVERVRNYYLHRIVMLSFIKTDKDRPFVNHIDACPEHNYLWNLEWCNASENYWHAVKCGLVTLPKGEQRKTAVWTDKEIHIVCKLMEEGHKPTYIYNILGDVIKDERVEYERVRTLYKHIKHGTHWKHIARLYNIDYTKYDYSKEKSSVRKKTQNENSEKHLEN